MPSILPKEGSATLVHFPEAMLLNNVLILPYFVPEGRALSAASEPDEVFVLYLICVLFFPQGAP